MSATNSWHGAQQANGLLKLWNRHEVSQNHFSKIFKNQLLLKFRSLVILYIFFRTTFKLSMQEAWNQKLNDKEKRYTFFVPNRKAWEDLKMEMPSEHKQLHLGQFSYHVHKVDNLARMHITYESSTYKTE